MSLTVAAVQFPHRYRDTPYEVTRRTTYQSAHDFSSICVKSHVQQPPKLESSNSRSPHRWSQGSDSNESTEEEPPMSGHGSASRPPPYDNKPEKSRAQGLGFPPQNVLPPLVYARAGSSVDAPSGRSQNASPKQPVVPAIENADRRGPRLQGVHSILNPSHDEESEDKRPTRRRNTAELVEDTRARFTPPMSIIASIGPASSHEGPASEAALHGQTSRTVRRILTPISPTIRKATSYGRLPGTIDALERPFPPQLSRRTTPDHVSTNTLPQISQSTSASGQQLPFIAPTAISSGQHYGYQSRRPSVSIVGSTRPSPSPSFADSYSQSGISGQTSPAMQPHGRLSTGQTPPTSLGMSPSPRLGPTHVTSSSLDNEQGFHNPVVSSGQNYQLLTVDTTRGHMQLPVEVQAASRMADEKRKRNAGASARFRARRKEREREAAGKISNLETDLLWAQEDSRFYRAERDFLVEVILRNVPQYEHLIRERPASPRAKRLSQGITRPSITSMDSPLSIGTSDPYESGDGEPPATRRRMDAYAQADPSSEQSSQHPYSPYTPSLAPGSMPPHPHYSQKISHVEGLPPPLLARPPPTGPTLPKAEHGYERPWPPRPSGTF